MKYWNFLVSHCTIVTIGIEWSTVNSNRDDPTKMCNNKVSILVFRRRKKVDYSCFWNRCAFLVCICAYRSISNSVSGHSVHLHSHLYLHWYPYKFVRFNFRCQIPEILQRYGYVINPSDPSFY